MTAVQDLKDKKERSPIVEKKKERQERDLVRGIRIEVLLSSGMILKQESERKLVGDFKLSGTIQKQ